MRELHVVAVSEDGRHVLLGPTKGSKSGTYRVRLDARLVAAVRGDLRSVDAPEVDLSPKEIQARLRAGESAEQIAQTAGVAVTRVARFQGPVAAEMARTLDAAREAFVVRGRRGRSTTPLGAVVDAALEPAGTGVVWSTRRAEDGRWLVSVAWTARGRSREAAWWYEPGRRDLAPVDAASAALGHVDAEPVRRTPKASAPVPKAAAAAPKAPAPARGAAAAKKAAKKAAKPAATPTATPVAKPAATVAARQTAKPVAKAPRKAAPKPSRAARPRLQVVPDPPAPPAPPRTRPKADPKGHKDGVTTRASVPAWADVLLGTTPGGER